MSVADPSPTAPTADGKEEEEEEEEEDAGSAAGSGEEEGRVGLVEEDTDWLSEAVSRAAMPLASVSFSWNLCTLCIIFNSPGCNHVTRRHHKKWMEVSRRSSSCCWVREPEGGGGARTLARA